MTPPPVSAGGVGKQLVTTEIGSAASRKSRNVRVKVRLFKEHKPLSISSASRAAGCLIAVVQRSYHTFGPFWKDASLGEVWVISFLCHIHFDRGCCALVDLV